MPVVAPFNEHVIEYDAWFKKYPYVFKSEVAAIRRLLPKGKDRKGIEIGVGTGRFAKALGIKEGIDPAGKMRAEAKKHGITVLNAVAEHLPYKSDLFDYSVMNFCVSYFDSVSDAFAEAYRVLKKNGILVVAFLDKNSMIGKSYRKRQQDSLFYAHAKFFTASQIRKALKLAGFRELEVSQTLFAPVDEIRTIEPAQDGSGKGSYIVVKATK